MRERAGGRRRAVSGALTTFGESPDRGGRGAGGRARTCAATALRGRRECAAATVPGLGAARRSDPPASAGEAVGRGGSTPPACPACVPAGGVASLARASRALPLGAPRCAASPRLLPPGGRGPPARRGGLRSRGGRSSGREPSGGASSARCPRPCPRAILRFAACRFPLAQQLFHERAVEGRVLQARGEGERGCRRRQGLREGGRTLRARCRGL